uniref:Desmoplakin n=2 Tax=Sinocyclocheilus grahami TaxID=75366 RepID=A0A672NLX0_SINGR
MVQQLVLKSKSIVRLKPRNPDEKITGQNILVQALCDFRQDEKTIRKGDEGILKDNSERTTWQVTGPGGIDMQVPAVCLLVPPPNPLAVSLANKNSQYYEAILTVWNQLYINVKSMISWQYCLLDINRINSLTINMLSKMGPEEYSSIIRSLEMHFQEFKKHSQGSELFGAEDHKHIESQYTGAQQSYSKLVVDLPAYAARGEGSEYSAAVSVKLLNELNALRLKLDGAESSLVTFLYIALGEDAPEECGRHIASTQVFQKDLQTLKAEFQSLRDSVQTELKDATDSDKARYLRAQLDLINQRLVHLENYSSAHLQRLNSLKSLLKDLLKAEDVVKVYEARLTEKETASLDPDEVHKYHQVLQSMRSDLEQKQDLLNSLLVDLNKIQQFNEQTDQGRYRCIINLSQYAEHVNQLSDRWKRIQIQINNRLEDLDAYLPHLQRYLQSNSRFSGWIDETQRQIDSQQAVKTDDITVYTQLFNQQKALNSDIKAKRELLETVQKDGETCINAIKNYELELAVYSAGLETLLNIPIKRTVLQSPSSYISEEVSSLNAHYLELLTRSSDYYKLLMASQKNMEELKIRNTRIELLEEELQQLRDAIKDHNATNASLQEALLKYQQELNESQTHLLSLEEVKRTETLKCMTTQDSLDSSTNRLQEFTDEVRRLKLQLDEMERKKKVVVERYTFLQEEHDETMRKKLKELEQASWAKMELEKTVSDRTRELEHLRRELEDEARRVKEVQAELTKVRQEHNIETREVKQTYESQILVTQTSMQKLSQQKESDAASMSLEFEKLEGESRELKEKLQRLRITLGQEEAQRKHLEEEAQRLSAVSTEEGRKRHELESQVQLLSSQKRDADKKTREVQESSSRALQEKSSEINRLTHCLEEERRLKRSLEAEIRRLEGELVDLKTKNENCNVELVQLRSSHQELSLIRVELEAHALEKGRSEQTITRLQARIQELQEELKRLESELEKQRQVVEEEASKRRRAEAQLEKSSQAMREYTTTITTLRKSQEETNFEAKHVDEECKQLKEALDRSLKEHKVSSQSLAALKAEMNTLKLQLTQEQRRVQDSNQHYEALHRRMEEKTCALNISTAETERLQRLNETLTKDRLRLEEELRSVRLEHEELLKNKKRGDRELIEQIAALQKQLESSQRASTEHDRLMRQLSREREKLQVEIENVQKQARETSSVIQTSQYQCNSLQQERDDLLKKMAAMEQDMMCLKKLEDELSRIKLSLESELRLKSQLQEDNERIKQDFTQWKTKCATHEEQIRKHNSECSGQESKFNSVKAEMERLRMQLKESEERYRLLLQNLERERAEMQSLRDSQQNELLRLQRKPDGATKYTQTDLKDTSSLVFEGVRKKVTAQQLHDCDVIDKVTFEQLMNGQRTVEDVSVDIRLNLKGTGAIAGLAEGPKGKMTFTEAKKLKLISDESGNMLLEAQAATGYIIDPRANVRMTVEEACLNGLVDEADKKQLLTAEAACIGFRDPKTGKLLPVSQAMKKGIVNRETALRLLQAQEAAGGILDPTLSVYLSKDTAMDRDLVDEDLYQALNAKPDCYIDPDTGLPASYVTLKKRCKADLNTSLLLLPAAEKPMTVQGLRHEVSVSDLVDAKLLQPSDVYHLREGKITSQDIEHRLRAYLRGSTCIAGIYDEANDCALPIYQAMKEGLLRPGTTLELLEAQAASGFIIDPTNNEYYTVEEACKKGLVGVEFKDKLLSAERAVTGYKDPGTNKMISLFEAIERGLIEKGHGIRLLEAQIASGGIIDPKHSHRIDVDVAYQRSYFDEEMNQILKDEGDDTKGFFDPNTEDNLTYLQLKSRCIPDKKTGLVLLPLYDKKKMQQKNSSRKRRVLIVDPESNKEMTVREAYEKKLIDYETFLELSQQECEWEETVITAPDGSTSTAIMDMQTGIKYDLKELLDKGVIDQDVLDKYRSGNLTLTELADMITNKTKTLSKPLSSSVASSSFTSQTKMKSPIIKTETVKTVESISTQGTIQDPFSTNTAKHISSMSIKLTPLVETIEEQNPVGAVFDTEKLEKISICDALKRGIIDSITAQRLLEAQACTGGIVSPENGRRISIQEATRLGVLDDEMANRIKPAQKAYIGFEDVKTKRKMSAAEAVKEKWLPYEAGQRFLEFQYLTGGLFDPELGCRRSLEEALQLGWLDMRAAQRLQDARHHPKTLTCPKSKLRISYKEALEGCMTEENTGVCMLPASTVSSRGISSPYNLSNPGSASGSRSGSRRGSVDYSLSPSSSSRYSSFSYSRTSFSSRSLS